MFERRIVIRPETEEERKQQLIHLFLLRLAIAFFVISSAYLGTILTRWLFNPVNPLEKPQITIVPLGSLWLGFYCSYMFRKQLQMKGWKIVLLGIVCALIGTLLAVPLVRPILFF